MGTHSLRWSLPLAALALGGAAPRIVFADGAWAALDRGTRCEAGSRALRVTSERGEQASAAILFARGGERQGVLALRLGKPPRPDATVLLTVRDQPFLLISRSSFAWSRGAAQETAIIAAMRGGGAMKVEAGAASGRRFVDRYSLDGAAGAIDAAAACAARR